MFKVSARTVLELGSELISSDIIAFYELIKNGFDAGSANGVEIRFNIILRHSDLLSLEARAQDGDLDLETTRLLALKSLCPDAPSVVATDAQARLQGARSRKDLLRALRDVYLLNTIEVVDTGSGMSAVELRKCFLVLGTPSRQREISRALHGGAEKAPYLGEKGIGRLSAMRLGERLRLITARKDDGAFNTLEIDWLAFRDTEAMLEDIELAPKVGNSKPTPTWSGTSLTISDLVEDWSADRVQRMARDDFSRLTDPFTDPKKRPRIALFWNEKRVEVPWMDAGLLAGAHATVTGRYSAEPGTPTLSYRIDVTGNCLGFEHPADADNANIGGIDLTGALVGTSGEVPESALVGVGGFRFQLYWYNRRILEKVDGIGDRAAVRKELRRWSGIHLFRDGFRVFPYGNADDDWLDLDRNALGRKSYLLNKSQFIGRIQISRLGNPGLVDQTNREGLRDTPEYRVLLYAIQYVVKDHLYRFLKSIEKRYRAQPIDAGEATSDIERLQKRATVALKGLRAVVGRDHHAAIEDVQQTIFELSEFAERAKDRIKQVEDEGWQLMDMAGVGLMVEEVAHELARASENALENLERLRGRSIPEEVRTRLESLRVQMKSLSKRIRVLDRLSVSGRQRSEVFDLGELIGETLNAHEAQFERHKIEVDFGPKEALSVRTVKGMVVQILENLISNSKYWLELHGKRVSGFRPSIRIALESHPPGFSYEDNGPGIATENREKVFRAFFSLKETKRRRGLGLFIARECAQHLGGTLDLSEAGRTKTGRLRRFVFELPEEAIQR